jgi:hypothetical protein
MAPASAALRALLARLIDYAGLFPPAALSMPQVTANYAAYRRSPDAWALGRLIVPAAKLGELSTAGADLIAPGDDAWRVSALVGDDVERDAAVIDQWNRVNAGRMLVDAIEARATTPSRIGEVARAFASSVAVYLELPVADDPDTLIAAVADAGARAKIRTGGVTGDAFPTAAQVARFIVRCAAHDVPFKATAGLHHPLRGEYRLTYAPDAEQGAMFGFLATFVAAAFARRLPEAELVMLLEERDASAFQWSNHGLRWRTHALSMDELHGARDSFAIAFGSCSFREPIDDLLQLGLT